MTKELKKQFRTLATVEEQIRSEIIRYEEEKLIPIEVPVKVRKTKGLAITALNKRYYTKSLKMSYSGQRPQTILFKMVHLVAATVLASDPVTAECLCRRKVTALTIWKIVSLSTTFP